MKILFLGRHYTYFRNFESVLRELASHGHEIHLAVEKDETLGGLKLVQALAAEYPNLTYGEAPSHADDEWAWTAGLLRLGIDYLRYQHPLFDQARKLRARARAKTPGLFVALGDLVHATGGWSRRTVSKLFRRIERAVPEDPAIRGFVEAQRPDLVLLTPLISLGSSQIDYLRAARRLGIPTALCVWSWDHLSSKALIRDCPDRVFVWNETQRQEAVELHELPADRVVVTGAQCFDQWFDRQPSRSLDDFCAEVGLPADRPFLLYVCSALFGGSPVEAEFVVEWISRIRSSGSPQLREAGILVRPHPSRLFEWDGIDTRALNAVIWGGNPVDAQSKADYFDSLFHSGAVTGINTSAFIEAGIVGRPVHTLILPKFEENQTGTVHFGYLLKAGGGLLHVAHTFDEHLHQLEASLANPTRHVKPFVREFVRPHGLDRAATPIFVEHVESIRNVPVETVPADALTPVWRWLLRHIARTRSRPSLERWVLSPRELESVVRSRRMSAQKAIRRAAQRASDDTARLAVLRDREARLTEEHVLREARLRRKQEERARKEERLAQRQRMADERRRASEQQRAIAARRSRLKNLIKQKLGFSSR